MSINADQNPGIFIWNTKKKNLNMKKNLKKTKCQSMPTKSNQLWLMPLMLIGIDWHWSAMIGIDQSWLEFVSIDWQWWVLIGIGINDAISIGIDRHWAMIQGVLQSAKQISRNNRCISSISFQYLMFSFVQTLLGPLFPVWEVWEILEVWLPFFT